MKIFLYKEMIRMETGMTIIKTKNEMYDNLKATVCPCCYDSNEEDFIKLDNYTRDPNFVCYHGFGNVQYHIMPWYCKNCKQFFTTWMCERQTNVVKEILILLAISVLTFLPVVCAMLVWYEPSNFRKFLLCLSIGLAMAIDIPILLNINENNNEPKNIDDWINCEMKDRFDYMSAYVSSYIDDPVNRRKIRTVKDSIEEIKQADVEIDKTTGFVRVTKHTTAGKSSLRRANTLFEVDE
jgi:hypothetical protein